MIHRNYQAKPRTGAEFHRCALQVNPAGYANFRGNTPKRDSASHARAMVSKARKCGISVLAITDHNNADDIDLFREAARGQHVAIFPGFEISSSEGIHVLCIYPEATSRVELSRFLGELGIRKTDPSSDLSHQSFSKVLATVKDQGGLAIAAHVTSAGNGLLGGNLSGQARINAWRDPNLLAIQIPASTGELGSSIQPIVRNENPDYRRERSAGRRLGLAVVNAYDVVNPEDLDQPAATVRIKMSEPSIEGFRQAFLDPDSRILLNSDASPPEHAELSSIEWIGGFLDGTVVRLNPNLNVVIGGRGAGKSTIIESIRYVLAKDPIGNEAADAHQGIVRQVLRPGTKVVLRLRVHHPATADYYVERTVPNPPLVRDEKGALSKLSPSDIVPDIEVYGQHEISELAASDDKLVRLLDRFMPYRPATIERKDRLRRDLAKMRQTILAHEQDLAVIEAELASLPGLEETLERYETAKLDEKLKEQSLFVREERVLGIIEDRFEPFRRWLDALRNELPIDRAFLSAAALSGLPSHVLLAKTNQPLRRLDEQLAKVADDFQNALDAAEVAVEAIRRTWNDGKAEAQVKYEAILRELRKTAVVAEEYIEIQRKIGRLAPLKEKQRVLRQQGEEHLTQRQSLCAEWEDLKAAELRMLHEAAGHVNEQLRGQVEVEVVAVGDRSPLTELLRHDIGGRLKEALAKLECADDLSLPEFVEACRRGADALVEEYGMPLAQAGHLASASSEMLMRIEELALPSKLVVRLNTAPNGVAPSWQNLGSLSKGQKATAILLLIMLKPDAPLVIDQPEDDLDNRFITEGVVPMIREAKRRRQFVLATHNANIPVLGDAELIAGLTPRGEAGEGTATVEPGHIGAIDDKSVRELVEELLEGGRHAFETRRVKYGF